ncbi:MAG: helix-turn-helix domain-containing protein [Candidatus Omnitrophica bacterium]|nr:helix-turn-helix domain-containing protein [Candidatus Omnitrophota bacterium]
MIQKRFIGIKDLSEYLDVSEHTIKSWVYSKRIPFKKIGRLIKFDRQRIDSLLENNNGKHKFFC